MQNADFEKPEADEKARRRPKERQYVLDCLRRYGENSLCYLSLEEDKQWFFPEKTEGFAAYAMAGRIMVICGDPVCAPENLPDFLEQLHKFAKRRHLRIVFLFVLEKNLPCYRKEGYGSYKSGEEAVFDVQSWSMSGGKMAKVRSSWHTAVNHGLHVEEYLPWQKRDADIERQMQEISDSWLGEKHTARLQFAMGSMMLDQQCDKRYFYAVDGEGIIQGFNVLNPYCSGKGWIIDIMRRRQDCPHGVMELLFHDIMEKLKTEGCLSASLGIAPFFNTLDEAHPSLLEKAEHYVYNNMNYIYGFKPLKEAKAKYRPVWKNVYLVCRPRHMTPWMDLAACSVLDSAGFHDYVDAFLEMKEQQMKDREKSLKENGKV